MKYIVLSVLCLSMIWACKNDTKEQTIEVEEVVVENAPEAAFDLYGVDFSIERAYEATVLGPKYEKMQLGDTVSVTIKGKVNSVCQKKGCWMRLDLGADKELFVKFKDYGFFVPLDLVEGTEVYLAGKAYKEATSVEDLKHLAEDAGKPQSEIDAITEPEEVYSFVSSGVKIPVKS